MNLRDDLEWNDRQMQFADLTADWYLLEDDSSKALYWMEKANYHRARIERILEEKLS